jgi:predicted enzyme related to lactoylglutathione lyase
MPNPVVRWQILSPKPDESATFYEKLFAWKLTDANALGYRELANNVEGSIDGGIWPSPQATNSVVQLFVEVSDIDASIGKAEKLGARLIVPKSTLPDGDTMAVLLDPTGLSFGLCRLHAKNAGST